MDQLLAQETIEGILISITSVAEPNRAVSSFRYRFSGCLLGPVKEFNEGLELLPKILCLSDSPSVYEFIVKIGIASDEAIPQDFFSSLKTLCLNKLFPVRGVSIPNNETFD